MGTFKHLMLASMIALGSAISPTFAQDLIIGFSKEGETLDPANHRNRETETLLRNVYEGLLTRDASMKLVPEIAESYEQVSPTIYDFRIRKGIRFHDGSDLTAEDVRFTFERILKEGAMGDGQTSPRQGLLGPVTGVELVDANTVRFNLSELWPILPAMLPNQQIVSKAFVEKNGTAGMATQAMGSGPFSLGEWRRGEALILNRFDDYFGGSPEVPPVGRACVDRAIFRTIPETASRVAALLSGDVHIINELPNSSIRQIQASGVADVVEVNGTRSFFLAMNMQGEIFDDIRVRQAAAHAVNKDLLIDKILGGSAARIEGILSPDAFGASELPQVGYDVEKARALLAEAGYPDGIDITLDAEGAYRDMAEAIASMLTRAGFRTSVAISETTMLTQKWRTAGGPKSGDMWLSSWGNGSLDPFDIFAPTHATNDRGNSAGYSNPELDKLLVAAAIEMDAGKRAEMYHRAEMTIVADQPYVYLWVPRDIYGVSKRVEGFHPSADSRILLHDVCLK